MCIPKPQGSGVPETAKGCGCLVRTEDETGKGLPWPLQAVGPPSLCPPVSWLLVRQLKGAVWGQLGDPPVCVLSQAHGEPGQGIVLGL